MMERIEGKQFCKSISPLALYSCSKLFCGAGGIRTLVQSGEPYAFYKFSLNLIFDRGLAKDNRPSDLSSKFRSGSRHFPSYPELNCTLSDRSVRNTSIESISSPYLVEWIKLYRLGRLSSKSVVIFAN